MRADEIDEDWDIMEQRRGDGVGPSSRPDSSQVQSSQVEATSVLGLQSMEYKQSLAGWLAVCLSVCLLRPCPREPITTLEER